VARLRADALHRATTMLTRQHDVIAAEGWNVREAARYRTRGKVRPARPGEPKIPARVRRDRNRSLADAGIGMARQMLVYKGARLGVRVMITPPGRADRENLLRRRNGKNQAAPAGPGGVLLRPLRPPDGPAPQHGAGRGGVGAAGAVQARAVTRRPGHASWRERKTWRWSSGRRPAAPAETSSQHPVAPGSDWHPWRVTARRPQPVREAGLPISTGRARRLADQQFCDPGAQGRRRTTTRSTVCSPLRSGRAATTGPLEEAARLARSPARRGLVLPARARARLQRT
jgi:hypothetical protein